MEFAQLNTRQGLETFLTEYHKRLSAERNFKPLGIGKALHTAAPIFEFENWHDMAAALKAASETPSVTSQETPYKVESGEYLVINGVTIHPSVTQNEMVSYAYIPKSDYMNDVRYIIKNVNDNKEKDVRIDELLRLAQLPDEYLFIGTEREAVALASTDADMFNEICRDFLYASAEAQPREEYGYNFPVGSIISMFGEILRITRNHGQSGSVEYLDGEFVSNGYYWNYQGERAVLLATPEHAALWQNPPSGANKLLCDVSKVVEAANTMAEKQLTRSKTVKVRFYDIDWDTDGEKVDTLPGEATLEVDSEIDIALEGADVLSDKYGFCVHSFSFDVLA